MKGHVSAVGAEPDYARLRYVTANFQSLQGLTWVVLGSVFLFSSIEKSFDLPLPFWLLLVAVVSIIAANRYIPKYYRSRFGTVEPRGPSNKHAVIFLLVLLGLGLFGRPVGSYLDSVIPQTSNQIHLMISDPDHRTNLLPVTFWAVLLCASGLRRPRFLSHLDVPFYLACFLFFAFALVFYPLRHPEVAKLTSWKVLNAGWFGISLIVTGLYDHLTLIALLSRRVGERDDE